MADFVFKIGQRAKPNGNNLETLKNHFFRMHDDVKKHR